MRVRGALVAIVLCVAGTGCSGGPSAPAATRSSPAPTEVPSYDASLPPAQAVLALVPAAATEVRLVDWDVVRRDVGLPGLTSSSSAADRAALRVRTPADSPLLDRSLLEGVDARLRSGFGFGADDVAWEAHWTGPGVRGWAISFGPGVDMDAVRRAVRVGVGPLRHAAVKRGGRLVVRGPADGAVWASDATWAALVPEPGEAFVVRRGCLDPGGLPAQPASIERLGPLLEPLARFAVTFGDHVATVRVDRDRTDVFARVRLARAWPLRVGTFGQVFRSGVGDPSSGRIGYDVPRPPRAAALVRRDLLPFGVCAPAR